MLKNNQILILAEKKSVAENYIKALNLTHTGKNVYQNKTGDITVTYAAGHLYTAYDAKDYDEKYTAWKKETLPVIPEKFKYKPINDRTKTPLRKEIEQTIKAMLEKNPSAEIVIATDPDREGEVIARLILDKIGVPEANRTRVWMCEGLSREIILQGLEERKSDREYDVLAQSGFAQKESDWNLGINLSRMVSIIKNEKFTLGRVQTALLKEIYRNENSRKLFVSVPYYQLKAVTKTGTVFNLLNPYDDGINFKDRLSLEKIKNEIEAEGRYTVTEKKVEVKKVNPPHLYCLSTLQMDCHRLYSYSPSQTLEIAQSLYNEKGVSSYPRTDCEYLSEEDYDMIIRLYNKLKSTDDKDCYEENLKMENHEVFDSAKLTGHHAIIPTTVYENKDNRDYAVYELIRNRFMMQFMNSYVYEEQKAVVRCGQYRLRGEGKKIVEAGWKRIEKRLKEESEKKPIEENEGEEGEIESVEIITKHTLPEELYTQASLLSFMKNPLKAKGEIKVKLGTAATQGETIKKLFDMEYIREDKKKIRITEKGTQLCEFIMDYPELDEITGIEVTDRWEKQSEREPEILKADVRKNIRKIKEILDKDMELAEQKRIIGECPSCHKEILAGKKGFYCSGYKEGCKNSLLYHVYGNTYDEAKIRKLLGERQLDEEKGVTKDGRNIRYRIRIDDEGSFCFTYLEDEKICSCPKCGSEIGEYGKSYRCRNRDCDFFLWKETSGIKISREMCMNLCERKKIKTVRELKDGGTADIELFIDFDEYKLKFEYGKR